MVAVTVCIRHYLSDGKLPKPGEDGLCTNSRAIRHFAVDLETKPAIKTQYSKPDIRNTTRPNPCNSALQPEHQIPAISLNYFKKSI